jgi:hypothetical protein
MAIKSQASYVERGYGQVEPNHLSAQRTGQIYAQLPAASTINVLENGQFVKYNYKDGVVDFAGAGEWMLVLNEVKLYHDNLGYADFAMVKENYNARVYSPIDGENSTVAKSVNYEGVVLADPYAPDATTNPFTVAQFKAPKMMPEGTTMVPRVFKTNVGDIFTTNTVNETELASGDLLAPAAENGILAKVSEGTEGMLWQVVKVYTMPDHQKGAKIMRIA